VHADACVVDEYIYAAEFFNGGVYEPLAFFFIAYIAGDRMEDDVTVIALEVVEFVVVSAAGSYFGAHGYEGVYEGAAYAVCAAGDNDYFISEKFRHENLLVAQTYVN
jgi:hypothetical protein